MGRRVRNAGFCCSAACADCRNVITESAVDEMFASSEIGLEANWQFSEEFSVPAKLKLSCREAAEAAGTADSVSRHSELVNFVLKRPRIIIETVARMPDQRLL